MQRKEFLMKKRYDAEEKLTEPNLFRFATSELSQDAFICWLFEHINLKEPSLEKEIAEELLHAIFKKFQFYSPEYISENLMQSTLQTIETQWKDIDVLLEFKCKNIPEQKLMILIEDKTDSGESRKNQVEYYYNKVGEHYEDALIVPIILKTGYVPQQERKKLDERNIVLISAEDMYNIFQSKHIHLKKNPVIYDWWQNFLELYYKPIQRAEDFPLDSSTILKDIQTFINNNEEDYSEQRIFERLIQYLFANLNKQFSTKLFTIQGKGHIDLHYEVTKDEWKDKEKNIQITIVFVWDKNSFKLAARIVPYQYQPYKQLNDKDKEDYEKVKKTIKNTIRKKEFENWSITNYKWQFAKMKDIEHYWLDTLGDSAVTEIDRLADLVDEEILS